MRHMRLHCLAICQFAIFPQAHFEPVEQFQPIWQKTKGFRHRKFGIFHQKAKQKEEKNPVYCCVCGWQGGWQSTQHCEGVWGDGAELHSCKSTGNCFLSRALHKPASHYCSGVCRFQPKIRWYYQNSIFFFWFSSPFSSKQFSSQEKHQEMGYISERNGKKARGGVIIA